MLTFQCFHWINDELTLWNGQQPKKDIRPYIKMDYCRRFSPLQPCHSPQAGSEPILIMSSDFDELSCAAVITSATFIG